MGGGSESGVSLFVEFKLICDGEEELAEEDEAGVMGKETVVADGEDNEDELSRIDFSGVIDLEEVADEAVAGVRVDDDAGVGGGAAHGASKTLSS